MVGGLATRGRYGRLDDSLRMGRYVLTCVPVLLRDLLLTLMLGLPAPYRDPEPPEERQTRLMTIAQAVTEASHRATCTEDYAVEECERLWPGQPLDLALLLITQAYSESRLARNVHAGDCRPYECDPFKSRSTGKVVHRARSLWQIHHTRPVDAEWDRMVGVDEESTGYAAWAATKMLSLAYHACRSIPGAISRYAGWRRCDWPGAARRTQLFEVLRQRTARLLSPERRATSDTLRTSN
jgi:hypothetical protein